jgi:hypothetical protein
MTDGESPGIPVEVERISPTRPNHVKGDWKLRGFWSPRRRRRRVKHPAAHAPAEPSDALSHADDDDEYLSVHATLRVHALITARLGRDPGAHLADLTLARAGHELSQLAFHGWLTDRVRQESKCGLNARSRSTGLLAFTTADIFQELVTGNPMGSREAMAERAGTAKGTYVRFRARVFEPIKAAFVDYRERASRMARSVNIDRNDGEPTRYKFERPGF